MAEEVRKHDKVMGETGQGLESESKIIPGTPLAQTWGECVSGVYYAVQCLSIYYLKPRSREYVHGIIK